MALEDLTPEELAVFKAWTVMGSHPRYHWQQQRRVVGEWPALYAAVRRIVLKGVTPHDAQNVHTAG